MSVNVCCARAKTRRNQELEASEEQVRALRQQMYQERDAKEEAQKEVLERQQKVQEKDAEAEVLKDNALRLHKELDILRAQIVESDRQHEEEVVRLRTGACSFPIYLDAPIYLDILQLVDMVGSK